MDVTLGEKIVYKDRAGIITDAWVQAIRPDGTVDIACDIGSRDLHELSRIPVVTMNDLDRGTCARGLRNGRRI